VVEHVRARRDDYLQRAGFRRKSGVRISNRRARAMGADRLDRPREMRRAAVGKIVAVDRRDDDMRELKISRRRATRSGSVDRAGRQAVATLQKAQARVQTSPMIMKVACFCSAFADVGTGRLLADGGKAPASSSALVSRQSAEPAP